MKAAKFGIVFDIDGVLMKSDRAIPEACGALDLLHSHPEYVHCIYLLIFHLNRYHLGRSSHIWSRKLDLMTT